MGKKNPPSGREREGGEMHEEWALQRGFVPQNRKSVFKKKKKVLFPEGGRKKKKKSPPPFFPSSGS